MLGNHIPVGEVLGEVSVRDGKLHTPVFLIVDVDMPVDFHRTHILGAVHISSGMLAPVPTGLRIAGISLNGVFLKNETRGFRDEVYNNAGGKESGPYETLQVYF
jgi:hypothetical protein